MGVNRKKYNKKYHQENKEYNHIACKKYRETHKEEISIRQKKWYQQNKGRVKAYNLEYLYGITTKEYDNLYTKQQGCCAICGIHQSKFNVSLQVDHNHINNKIRGLLCQQCNTAIGSLKVDEKGNMLLIKAIEYIKE